MQKEILEQYPAAKLRVYVIWFSMLPTDARSSWGWTSGVLADRRATHFWDEKRVVGTWLAKQETPEANSPSIVWDAFYLFDAGAEWDASPEPLIIKGATVNAEANRLREKLVPLFNEKAR